MRSSDENADLRRAALGYHERPRPGKISVTPTKQPINQHDLALAYSLGVATEAVRRLGITPRVALLSRSNCGSSDAPSAETMRQALAALRRRAPTPEVDGEMHANCALDSALRRPIMPHSTLPGPRISSLPRTTVRRIVDMTALTVVDANAIP